MEELDEAKSCKGHCKSVGMDSLDITDMDGIRDSITINRQNQSPLQDTLIDDRAHHST